jgi:hypothetical protein
MNSGPSSDRTCVGMPRNMKRSECTSITSVDLSFRLIRIAKHSRVNSSTTFSMRYFLPSCVRSSTKSYDQTWFGYSGRKRMQDSPLSHSRPRFGRFDGTFRRVILSMEGWLYPLHPNHAAISAPPASVSAATSP